MNVTDKGILSTLARRIGIEPDDIIKCVTRTPKGSAGRPYEVETAERFYMFYWRDGEYAPGGSWSKAVQWKPARL